jgi:SAM-dependent methyltransferase
MTPPEAQEKMKELFCSEALNKFESLIQMKNERPYTPDELYSVPTTLAEAALLFSPQAHLVSACGQHLYRTIKPHLCEGAKVADAGCGVGSWTRWMAHLHPEVQFVGIDRNQGMIDIARAADNPANLQYELCDYEDLSQAYGRYDVVTSLLGVDFDPGVLPAARDDLSATDPSTTPLTHYFRQTFSKTISGWRKILTPGGVVATVLRLVCFEAWYGCILGAKNEGFRFDPERSSCIALGKQRYPLVVFSLDVEAPLMSLDELLAWWVERTGSSADAQVLVDTAALLHYRQLQDKRVMEEVDEEYEDGHLLRRETGLSGEFGYVYEYATTLYRRLERIPIDRLKQTSTTGFVATEEHSH